MKRMAMVLMVLMACHSAYIISQDMKSGTDSKIAATVGSDAGGPDKSSVRICPITGKPLNPEAICPATRAGTKLQEKVIADGSMAGVSDVSAKPLPTGDRKMTLLTPEQLKARVYAIDPTNRFAYPGRPYVIGSTEWVLDDSRFLDSPKIPGVTGPHRNHRATGRLSDRFSNIELKTEDGEVVRFYDDLVKDQIVIITFFYTRCSGICAPTNDGLVELRKLLAGTLGKDVRFLSISLDSDFDKPEVLKAFAAYYKPANSDAELALPGWDFLCGDWDEINVLRREMGVYDLDPVVDTDRSQHAGIITYGNDRTSRWSATPSLLPPKTLHTAILKITGSHFMDPHHEVRSVTSKARWETRGPMVEIRPWAQQMSVIGATMLVPNDLTVDGTTGLIGRNLKDLTDSTVHQGQRVLLPYPKQTSAIITSAGGYDDQGRLVADHLRVDLADHLLGGKLTVDSSGQLRMQNVAIVENPDLRFPMQILDAVGNDIPLEEMPSCPGLPATARGYYLNDVFFATLLQVDRRRPMTHETGIVQVHAAVGDHQSGVLRVFGTTAVECLNSEVHVFDAITDRLLGSGKVVSAADGKSGSFVVQLTSLELVPSFVKVKCGAGSMAIGSPRTVVNPAVLAELPAEGMFFVYGPLQSVRVEDRGVCVNGITAQIDDDTLVLPLHTDAAFRAILAGDAPPTKGSDNRSFLPSDYNSGFPLRLDCRQTEFIPSAETTDNRTPDETLDSAIPVATLCTINAEECSLTGLVESVNDTARTAVIGGVVVRMQEDERMGLKVTTGTGRPLQKSDLSALLQGLKGRTVTVRGYSHLLRRAHAATEYQPVEASIVAVYVELPDGETALQMDASESVLLVQ